MAKRLCDMGYRLCASSVTIRPALERAIESGKPACVNVLTDPTIPHPVSKMAAEMFGVY
jgi:thiamine pyrophosphate-dependent acetolactate synthase large subunit-like protein